MKNNVKWELNPEIVARHFLRNVSTPKHHYSPKMEATPGKKQLRQDWSLLGKGVIIQLKLGKAFFFFKL